MRPALSPEFRVQFHSPRRVHLYDDFWTEETHTLEHDGAEESVRRLIDGLDGRRSVRTLASRLPDVSEREARLIVGELYAKGAVHDERYDVWFDPPEGRSRRPSIHLVSRPSTVRSVGPLTAELANRTVTYSPLLESDILGTDQNPATGSVSSGTVPDWFENPLDTAGTAVVVVETGSPRTLELMQSCASSSDTPWYPIFVQGRTIVFGPQLGTGHSCLDCLRRRLRMNSDAQTAVESRFEDIGEVGGHGLDLRKTRVVSAVTAALGRGEWPVRRAGLVEIETGQCDSAKLVPVPHCERCCAT